MTSIDTTGVLKCDTRRCDNLRLAPNPILWRCYSNYQISSPQIGYPFTLVPSLKVSINFYQSSASLLRVPTVPLDTLLVSQMSIGNNK